MLKLVLAGLASLLASLMFWRRRQARGEDVWHEATKPVDLR
jgi:hypothetical protein